MSAALEFSSEPLMNPIDLAEELVHANDWAHQRNGDDELVAEISGQWCDYRIYFAWSIELGALHYSCAFDMKVPRQRRQAVFELLAVVNEQLWVGHFDIGEDDGLVLYRHTALMRGGNGVSVEQMEDLIDISLVECERFYPAFQFVVWGGKSAASAIEASMLETVGEA